MESLALDVRFALRSLRRRPAFAAIAIATIALTIAASTAIYSVVDGVLFRSLPFRSAGRLVAILETRPDLKKQPVVAAVWDRIGLSYPEFQMLRRGQHSFDDVGVWSAYAAIIPGADSRMNERLIGSRVSSGLLELLGVTPIIGRTFLPGEDVIGGPHVLLLSHDQWQARYGGSRDVLGKMLVLNDVPYEIVGVLPPRFNIDRGSNAPPFLIPAGQDPGDSRIGNRAFTAIGRLKSGVTTEQATAEAAQLLRSADTPANGGAVVTSFQRDQTRNVRTPLLILLGAVGLLLLIGTVNVALLMLGEATNRGTEMGTRVALGASRTRILRQVLTESLVLAAAGAALGVVLAWWLTKGLVALAPSRIPGIRSVAMDGRVLFAALIAATLVGIVFGVAPALTAARSGLVGVLRAGGATSIGTGRLQQTLIALELGMSVVLVICAGLLARSLINVTRVDPGFRTDHLLAIRIAIPREVFRDSLAVRAFYDAALDRIVALPGVAAVTATSMAPFSGGFSSSPLQLEGEEDARGAEQRHAAQDRVVVPNYFSALGIPVLQGRAFAADDRAGAEPVAIVSESGARRDWPGESAIGKRVKLRGVWRRIVGVVADVKLRQLTASESAAIYTPLAQQLNNMTLLVRTRGDGASVLPALRTIIHDIAPAIFVLGADAMDQLIRVSFSEERFRTLLIDVFGALALLLAAVGVYGVTSRAVSRRTREVGIRVALGATSRSVIALMLRHSLSGMVVGISAGLVAAAFASRALGPFLFGVGPFDAATYGGMIAFLSAVLLVGSLVPARRAARVTPTIALRE